MTAPTFNNLNIHNSAVGVVNTGTYQQLDSAITVINKAGGAELAHAIQQLTEAVAKAQDIGEDSRRDALGFLNVIAEQAKAQPGEPLAERRDAVPGDGALHQEPELLQGAERGERDSRQEFLDQESVLPFLEEIDETGHESGVLQAPQDLRFFFQRPDRVAAPAAPPVDEGARLLDQDLLPGLPVLA